MDRKMICLSWQRGLVKNLLCHFGPVLPIPLGDKTDFLAEPYRSVYDFYRKGGSSTPANMQES